MATWYKPNQTKLKMAVCLRIIRLEWIFQDGVASLLYLRTYGGGHQKGGRGHKPQKFCIQKLIYRRYSKGITSRKIS